MGTQYYNPVIYAGRLVQLYHHFLRTKGQGLKEELVSFDYFIRDLTGENCTLELKEEFLNAIIGLGTSLELPLTMPYAHNLYFQPVSTVKVKRGEPNRVQTLWDMTADKDYAGRQSLKGVYVHPDGDKLIATDGIQMSIVLDDSMKDKAGHVYRQDGADMGDYIDISKHLNRKGDKCVKGIDTVEMLKIYEGARQVSERITCKCSVTTYLDDFAFVAMSPELMCRVLTFLWRNGNEKIDIYYNGDPAQVNNYPLLLKGETAMSYAMTMVYGFSLGTQVHLTD
jgi:hypothetical protein